MEFKEFLEFSKVYGSTFGSYIFLAYFIWERIINPFIKKQMGTFVTWKMMKDEIEGYHEEVKIVNREIGKLKTVMESKLERELVRDSLIKTLQDSQEKLGNGFSELTYVLRDITGNIKTNNRLIGEVKDYLGHLKSGPTE